MGPTATGKSDLAVELFDHLPVELISVDSAMVYKGLDIGTGKPAKSLLAEIPHHLIDICEPTEIYSVARFCNDAWLIIRAIQARGKIPLFVGGTSLYFRSLELGISALPSANQAVRQKIAAEAKKHGWRALHRRLAEIDSSAAKKIHPHDPQRIQRALEVYAMSGRPLTKHYLDGRANPLPFNITKIILNPMDRTVVWAKIKHRFLKMLDNGLLEEVERLRDNLLNKSMPAMRLVGYRQAWHYLEGDIDYSTMTEQAIIATRQLAKRQLTWLRKEKHGDWFDSGEPALRQKILTTLRRKLTLP